MKRFKALLQGDMPKQILESAAVKLLLGAAAVFLWNWLVNAKSIASAASVGTGCFFMSIYFLVWAWLQYLVTDGVKSLRFLKEEEDEDGEQTIKRLVSNLLCAAVFLIPGLLL